MRYVTFKINILLLSAILSNMIFVSFADVDAIWQKRFDTILKVNKINESYYELASNAIKENNVSELYSNLVLYLKGVIKYNKTKFVGINQLTSTYGLLKIFNDLNLDLRKEDKFFNWLTKNNNYHRIIVNLEKQDKIKSVFRVARQLILHKPKQAKDYADLICAIALVRDEKPRKMHHQMGKKIFSPKNDIIAYYDYFYDLYSSRKSKILYNRLSIRELTFVVGGTAPVSELKWARENVKGKVKKWGDRYAEIVYDHDRMNEKQFNWIDGLYSLENIEKEGGICVDQAYYGVITARAWGIPAIYFDGLGKRGWHAWFGFSDGRKWFLDNGKYANDSYTTGESFNPQTQSKMKDHNLNFFLGGIRSVKNEALAQDIFTISKTLVEVGNVNLAEMYLLVAFSKYPLYEKNWFLWLSIHNKNLNKKTDILNKKLAVYRKYPDIYIVDASKLMSIYTKLDKPAEIKIVEGRLRNLVRKRDDLVMKVEYLKAQRFYENQKPRYARLGFERAIYKFLDQQEKIQITFFDYLKLTSRYGDSEEALKFTKKISKKIVDIEFRQFILYYAEKYHKDSLKKKKK